MEDSPMSIERKMILLSSVGLAVDEAMIFYPVNKEGMPDLSNGTPMSELSAEVFDKMSFSDVEFFQEFEVNN